MMKSSRTIAAKLRRRKGMVLFIVAVVTALVSLSALGFLVTMKAENRAAHLQADQLQVAQVGASADAMLRELARMPRSNLSFLGGLVDNRNLFKDVPVDWDVTGSRHGRFSILSPSYSDDSNLATYAFGVSLTNAKLSLEQLLVWDQSRPGHGRMALMMLPGMTESIADSILDWIDADDEAREFGAESEFYLDQDPPRQPPNRVPSQLDHLLAVRGVDAGRLLGNLNGLQSIAAEGSAIETGLDFTPKLDTPTMAPTQRPDAERVPQIPSPPWSHYLTVRSAERNESLTGDKKIDLNDPDVRRLHQALLIEFDQETANFVAAIRIFGPSETSIDQATTDSISSVPLTESSSYKLNSPLDLIDMVAVAESSDDAKRFRSPFSTREPSSMTKLIQWLDATTTDRASVLPGRVNVMLAPRIVLLGVPGISAELADQILSARERAAAEPSARQHAVWLLVEGLVDLPTMKELLPYVTVGGNIFAAQVVAYYDAQSPWDRHEIIVDGTTPNSSTLYYKDLRRLGRGFQYQQLANPPEQTQSTGIGAQRTTTARGADAR